MKKLYLMIMLLLFAMGNAWAQKDYFYYYRGEKVYLTIDKTLLNISVDESFQKSSLNILNFKDFNFEIDNSNQQIQKVAKLEFKNILSDLEFFQKINFLEQNANINNVSYYFKRTNAQSIGTSKYFYIKLNNENDFPTLEKIAIQKNVKIVKQVPYMPLWYILSVNKTTIGNSVELTNYFYETGLFADVDPAFMFSFKNSCTNDINFGSLWGLNNSANPNIDINACQAWNLSQGNGVKVAVLDQGIQTSHIDLAGNISTLSFDTQTPGGGPSVFNGASHGTHVAGTIGAIMDNNLQVVGVAPQCKIMPVSHSLNLTPNISAELASGISWAYQNGADVINNSWGDQGGQFYDQLYSPILESAITNAMIFGRNNKGTLIVFASGNYGQLGEVMDYPGNFSNQILTVGAIDLYGLRSIWPQFNRASGYGQKLDIVAPGSNILSTYPNNATYTDNGTSMASPHVAGVCALILAANPSLTGQQVRDIIEQTSQKIGGYSYLPTAGRPNGTWNNQMGYGLVDAYQAVLLAQTSGCATNISITTNVTGIDNKQASQSILATNTINFGASAIYHAPTVILKPSFNAKAGSTVRIYTDGCTNTFVARQSQNATVYNNSANTKTVFEKQVNVIAISPNPSYGIFKISLNEVSEGKIEILDLYGFTVYESDFKNQTDFEMNLQDRPKGIYIVKVFSGEQVFTSKIIKN